MTKKKRFKITESIYVSEDTYTIRVTYFDTEKEVEDYVRNRKNYIIEDTEKKGK